LKTWLFKTNCNDSADPACFCKNQEFIKEVVDCIDSYSSDDGAVGKAIAYFAGLCRPHVPENPGCVLGNTPDRITITVPRSVPVTTIVATVTQTVPCDPTVISGTTVTETTKTVPYTATVPQIDIQPTDAAPTPFVPPQTVPVTAAPSGPNTAVPTATATATPTTLQSSTVRVSGTAGNVTAPTKIPTFDGAATGLKVPVIAIVLAGILAVMQL